MNNKETLLTTLTEQVRYAFGLNGKLGLEAMKERQEAVRAVNATLEILETQFDMDPEDALEGAMSCADI
jgi:hypothetical protein